MSRLLPRGLGFPNTVSWGCSWGWVAGDPLILVWAWLCHPCPPWVLCVVLIGDREWRLGHGILTCPAAWRAHEHLLP